MISSGLSLLRALTILADQTENKALQKVVMEVRSDVETGSAFSKALGRHPETFPPLMINMVKAGEVGGFLDEVLVSIAANFEEEVKARQDQVRHDLPRGGAVHRHPWCGGHADLHRAGVRDHVRGPRRRAFRFPRKSW
ncbi:hypothetical protein GCM10025876_00200 [Demequina litorisediminis]|uniref:Type II secretion system protein GspF domain-containing protein n=1 Tax=Demequina litorisediminis TaxID=1849022 RepID=A0ABQ6I8L5_9MICO|nr:hypothetical protein GCM10025876_00200 [Demequina litorisediminis]